MTTKQQLDTASSWDKYWQGTQDQSAFSDGGVNHPALQTYWLNFFQELTENSPKSTLNMLDLACGNGALSHLLELSGTADRFNVTCVDTSEAALSAVSEKFPKAQTTLASALDTQLDSHSYDVVVSQFGLEYAGLEAVDEAIRLVTEGGQIRLLLHFKGGAIAGECTRNQQVVDAFMATGFLNAAKALFDTGYAAAQGGDRQAYDAAGKTLSKVLPQVEHLIQGAGTLAAADLLEKLYLDVGKIHNNLLKYDPSDVTAWLAQSESECHAYLNRMQSMLDAALDESEFHDVCRRLEQAGLKVAHAGPLLPHDNNRALAWAISTE